MTSYRSEALGAPWPGISAGWGVRQGMRGGFVAGMAFMAYEMVMAASFHGAAALVRPLRRIGAIVLGPGAMAPGRSAAAPVLTGLIVHVALAVIFGAIFGLFVAAVRETACNSTGGLVLAGGVFGLLLWLINFHIIAPAAFPWFTES